MKVNEASLIGIVSDALNINPEDLTLSSTSSEIENWDSLGHLNILVKLDRYLSGMTTEISELPEAESIKDLYDILKKNNLAE
jgi:acyl carrier protein